MKPALISISIQSIVLALVSCSAAVAADSVVSVAPGSCDAINAAIAKLPTEGGTVRLATGLYECDKTPVIISRDNVSLIGAGIGKTIVKAANARPLPVVIIGSVNNSIIENNIPFPDHVTHNIVVKGMTIDGNYHSHPKPGNVECWDPRNGQSQSCGNDNGYMIRNNGLTIRASDHVRASDFETKANYSGGIVTEKHCNDLVMDHFSTTDNWFDGFAGYETTASTFRRFKFYKNKYSGISVDASFEGNTFEDGVCKDNGDNGIFSADVSRNIYQRLKVTNNKTFGFFIDGLHDANRQLIPGSCDGNQILDSVVKGPRESVHINDQCKGTVLRNNQFIQKDLQCVTFPSGAEVTYGGSTCGNGKSAHAKELIN